MSPAEVDALVAKAEEYCSSAINEAAARGDMHGNQRAVAATIAVQKLRKVLAARHAAPPVVTTEKLAELRRVLNQGHTHETLAESVHDWLESLTAAPPVGEVERLREALREARVYVQERSDLANDGAKHDGPGTMTAVLRRIDAALAASAPNCPRCNGEGCSAHAVMTNGPCAALASPAPQPAKDACVHGHTTRTVGCVSCYLLWPQPAETHYDECPKCQQAKPCETMDRLAPAPVVPPCPNCGGMGETTHDIIVGGTEHDTEQRECDVCKGTGLAAAPAPVKPPPAIEICLGCGKPTAQRDCGCPAGTARVQQSK